MITSSLVARLMRVLETAGSFDNGEVVAHDYAEAVQRVNQRLAAVYENIQAGQVSNAVYLMEEHPRVLSEINCLEIPQFAQWEDLCKRHDWTMPPLIDNALLERILRLSGSADVVAPLLKMYRKAIRTNNLQLTIQSLRRLKEVDHTQDWASQLEQAEKTAQERTIKAFLAALAAQNLAEADQIATDFVAEAWTNEARGDGAETLQQYVATIEMRKRQETCKENLELLKRLQEHDWELDLVDRLVQATMRLVNDGVTLSAEDEHIVNNCRKRVEKERTEIAVEQEWKCACETLHSAVQREDAMAIRDALAASIFLDRKPDSELWDLAERVLQHDDAHRRRKVTQIITCIILGILVVSGFSGWLLKKKFQNDHCEFVIAQLTQAEQGERPLQQLDMLLSKLRESDPVASQDMRIVAFEEKLVALKEREKARCNEVEGLIAQLNQLLTDCEKLQSEKVDKESITQCMKRLNELLKKEDSHYQTYLKCQETWVTYQKKQKQKACEEAQLAHDQLKEQIEGICQKLNTTWVSENDENTIDDCQTKIKEWRETYLTVMPNLSNAINKFEQALTNAQQKQHNYREAVNRVKSASDAVSLLTARKTLCTYYKDYTFVKELADLSLTQDDVKQVLERKTPEHIDYASRFPSVSEEEFKSFLAESVLSLKEIPSLYSLYGVYRGNEHFKFLSNGKPTISKSSYDKKYDIDGVLFDLEAEKERGSINTLIEPNCEQTLCSKEIVDLCDFTDTEPSIKQFEEKLLKLLDNGRGEGHFPIARHPNFLKMEGEKVFYPTNIPAFRRLQLVYSYLTWLKDDLKLMPQTENIRKLFDFTRMERLLTPMTIGDLPKEITWACLKNDRIHKRNEECARFLEQLANKNPIACYREEQKMIAAFSDVVKWSYRFGGCVAVNADKNSEKWRTQSPLLCSSGVDVRAPLYVLRKENGVLSFVRAFAPNNKDGWFVAQEANRTLQPGEPLFYIMDGLKAIDPKPKLRELQKKYSNDPNKFIEKIPLLSLKQGGA